MSSIHKSVHLNYCRAATYTVIGLDVVNKASRAAAINISCLHVVVIV